MLEFDISPSLSRLPQNTASVCLSQLTFYFTAKRSREKEMITTKKKPTTRYIYRVRVKGPKTLLRILYTRFQCTLNSLSLQNVQLTRDGIIIFLSLLFLSLNPHFFAISLTFARFQFAPLCLPPLCIPSVYASSQPTSLLLPWNLLFFASNIPSVPPSRPPSASHFFARINLSASFEFSGFEVSERRGERRQNVYHRGCWCSSTLGGKGAQRREIHDIKGRVN